MFQNCAIANIIFLYVYFNIFNFFYSSRWTLVFLQKQFPAEIEAQRVRVRFSELRDYE